LKWVKLTLEVAQESRDGRRLRIFPSRSKMKGARKEKMI
jgi:hypothetical protein